MLNKLRWVPVLNDLRALAKLGLTGEQRTIVDRLLRNLIIAIFGAGTTIGALALYIALTFAGGAADTSLVPTVDTGDTINVPLSPGSVDALRICEDGIVTSGDLPYSKGYTAVLGPERIEYIDSPPGGKNLVINLNGNPQTVTTEVIKCLITRGK